MTPQEILQIITLARRAPLQNMAEAEVAFGLLQKLAAHFAPPLQADTESAQAAQPPAENSP